MYPSIKSLFMGKPVVVREQGQGYIAEVKGSGKFKVRLQKGGGEVDVV